FASGDITSVFPEADVLVLPTQKRVNPTVVVEEYMIRQNWKDGLAHGYCSQGTSFLHFIIFPFLVISREGRKKGVPYTSQRSKPFPQTIVVLVAVSNMPLLVYAISQEQTDHRAHMVQVVHGPPFEKRYFKVFMRKQREECIAETDFPESSTPELKEGRFVVLEVPPNVIREAPNPAAAVVLLAVVSLTDFLSD
ncbi:hypothetical protein C0J52_26237, partial [Blattella germanica]